MARNGGGRRRRRNFRAHDFALPPHFIERLVTHGIIPAAHLQHPGSNGCLQRVELGLRVRQVVAITAPERETLYANPEGYSYARYIGTAISNPTSN